MIRRKVRGYWSIDKLKEEALKYKTRGEFQKFSLSAYSTALRNGWLDDVCLHMTKRKLESFNTFNIKSKD